MKREYLEREFSRIVTLLAEGKGDKRLRNRLYDVALQLEKVTKLEELGVEAI